ERRAGIGAGWRMSSSRIDEDSASTSAPTALSENCSGLTTSYSTRRENTCAPPRSRADLGTPSRPPQAAQGVIPAGDGFAAWSNAVAAVLARHAATHDVGGAWALRAARAAPAAWHPGPSARAVWALASRLRWATPGTPPRAAPRGGTGPGGCSREGLRGPDAEIGVAAKRHRRGPPLLREAASQVALLPAPHGQGASAARLEAVQLRRGLLTGRGPRRCPPRRFPRESRSARPRFAARRPILSSSRCFGP
ncbi:unnamed protein product, partial [Prorocentrum cordatum]